MSNTWNNGSQGNKIVLIQDYKTLLDRWEFLLEGLQAVQANCKDNLPDVTSDQFFKTLAKVAFEPELGVIILLTSKNAKPLGYIVLVDNSELFGPKVVCIYIAYSNGKCASTIAELRHEGLRWAKEQGFEKCRAYSYRIKPTPARMSGAVRRYFSKTLGLRERCVVFETVLT